MRLARSAAFPVVIGLALLLLALWRLHGPPASTLPTASRQAVDADCRQVTRAFGSRRSHVWLTLSARVDRLLSDSTGRFTHQRFLVRCSSRFDVLVVNDVSIGARVPVQPGTSVGVHGEYIWNPEGGLLHFTHRSLHGTEGGWILYQGKLYG